DTFFYLLLLLNNEHRYTIPSEQHWREKKVKILEADPCLDLMSEGACSDYVLLWYFHAQSGECRPFVYGGCGGTKNQFSTRHRCQSVCVVSLTDSCF
uniref:BPTI/Kunitz inhibitor domain-containing protein n=1 Tax=Oryzias latipes TaxID=8090 RepID=A0A3P9HZB2_ORYLA